MEDKDNSYLYFLSPPTAFCDVFTSLQGLKNQPNLLKFGGSGDRFFKISHCSHKIGTVKKSESARSDFFQPNKFLNTELLYCKRESQSKLSFTLHSIVLYSWICV
jgi:hypothetical protein